MDMIVGVPRGSSVSTTGEPSTITTPAARARCAAIVTSWNLSMHSCYSIRMRMPYTYWCRELRCHQQAKPGWRLDAVRYGHSAVVHCCTAAMVAISYLSI
jgi:hypothetical protein